MHYESAFHSDYEHAGNVLTVPGRFFNKIPRSDRPDLWANQTWVSYRRAVKGYGPKAEMAVRITLDDGCKNGHNTFAMTAEISTPADRRKNDVTACGQLTAEMRDTFPELVPLLKWHLCSTDGPMHYLENTLYHAGSRDHYGLLAGEVRQHINRASGQLAWRLRHSQDQYFDGPVPPAAPAAPQWEPIVMIGEGKKQELDYARSTAIWPEATDEELSVEEDVLRAALIERLPKLMEQFQAVVEEAGFSYHRFVPL